MKIPWLFGRRLPERVRRVRAKARYHRNRRRVWPSVYEREGLAELGVFFESADRALSTPKLREIFAALMAPRGAKP